MTHLSSTPVTVDWDLAYRVAQEVLRYHFSRSKGNTVSVCVGQYCYKRGLKNPFLIQLVKKILEKDFRVVEYDGAIYELAEVMTKASRKLLRYRKVTKED